MSSKTLKRLVSDTERGLSQKKDAVSRNVEDVSNEGETGSAQLRGVQPTEALKVFFDRIPLESIPGIDNSAVVEVKADQTIEEAMRLLYEQDVLGAPVVDIPLNVDIGGPFSNQYVGLVDLGSMIIWALEEFEVAVPQAQVRGLLVEENSETSAEQSVEGNAEGTESAAKTRGQENDDFWSLLAHLDNTGSSKVGALARSFRWGPFLPVYPDNSLLHVLLLLSKHSLKAAPVVDPEENKVTGFITQDAAMHLLLQCSGLEWFDIIAEKQLSEFRFQSDAPLGSLVYVHGDKPFINAFHCVWKYRVNAVPVIDRETNQLIGCVRTADARILLDDRELFKGRRKISTKEFMEVDSHPRMAERNRSALQEEFGASISAAALSLGSFRFPPMQEPVTSTSTDTLKETIRKLVAARSDRSFMIDDERHLTGIITLRDIIVQFSPPLGEEPSRQNRWGDLFENALCA